MEKKTVELRQDLSIDGEEMSRRRFMGGMGVMAATAALGFASSSRAFADEVDSDEVEGEDESTEETESSVISTTGWTGTPEELLALGVSTMPLDDLNAYRQRYVDAQTDYVCEDGTVIPAVYVKARALINTYGAGCGNNPVDSSFVGLMNVFSEDDAQAYIDMPMGVEFTAFEMAEKTGRDVDECTDICERAIVGGFLFGVDTNRGRLYRHIPLFQGIAEYNFTYRVESDGAYSYGVAGSDFDSTNGGTPVFYYVPVDYSVTSDGTILPFDDLRKKLLSKNLCAIAPCYCRYRQLAAELGHENIPSFADFATGEYEDYFSPLCDLRVETCIMTGDEAAYWIEQGWAREITPEKAVEYLERSVEDGFMLESTFGKNTETICSCHIGRCGILDGWFALGEAEDIAAARAFNQVSHYRLEVDPDKCIACGLCVERCPMQIITINDEGWAEPAASCFRCGQCAYVCPQGARVLVQRDESELAPLPQSMLDDSNAKAAYRFETGLITL